MKKIRSITSIIESLNKEDQKETLSVAASISGVPMWVDDVINFIKRKSFPFERYSKTGKKIYDQ